MNLLIADRLSQHGPRHLQAQGPDRVPHPAAGAGVQLPPGADEAQPETAELLHLYPSSQYGERTEKAPVRGVERYPHSTDGDNGGR